LLAARAASGDTETSDTRSPLNERDRGILAAILHQRRTEDPATAKEFATRASGDHSYLARASQALLAVETGNQTLTIVRFGLTVTFYGATLESERLERRLGLDSTDPPYLKPRVADRFAGARVTGRATNAFHEMFGHLTAGRHRTPTMSELKGEFRVSGWLAWGQPMTTTQRAWLGTLRETAPGQHARILASIKKREPSFLSFAIELVRELTAERVGVN
jgi:hypothetical protein